MYFEDFQVGHSTTLAPAIIKKEDMIDFALKYDNIPLHTDEEYAASTNFGALIAPGVMSFMSVWAKFLEVNMLGSELLAGKSTKIEWHRPVYANDVLTGIATITALTGRNVKNGIVEITTEVFNQKGDKVLSNVTEAIVKCRGDQNGQ